MLPFEPYRRNTWRLIEGQYRSSTRKIVDTLEEHRLLEQALEDSKPPVPDECRHLDYQFWSPFRYGRYPRESRFRRSGRTPGVYYSSEDPLTAALEYSWGMVCFYRASPDTRVPTAPITMTAIQSSIAAPVSIDLRHSAVASEGRWTHPTDYGDCVALADAVRAEGCEAIIYSSVRHPDREPNVAVLTCSAFDQPIPIATQTWHQILQDQRLQLTCETLRRDHEFLVREQTFQRAT